MRAKQVIFLLICMMLVLYGCTGGTKATGDKFRTGSKGVALSFIPGSPPEKILGDGRFAVGIQVRNVGTTSIDGSNYGGNIYVSGFDKNIIRFDKYPVIDGIGGLAGRTSFDPVGELQVKEFQGNVVMHEGIDTYKPTFLVTACYSYETLATPLVCVDSDPFGVTTKQKVCTSKDVSLSGGQGAPLAVQRVELNPGSDKLRFIITLANVGGGVVFDEKSDKCSPYSDGLAFKELDLVRLVKVEAANKDITDSCKPAVNREVKLIEGKRAIFCELPIKGTDLEKSPAFNTPLTIKFRYGYRDSISKSIEAVRIPSSGPGGK